MDKPSSVILEAVFCEPSHNILQESCFTVKNLVACVNIDLQPCQHSGFSRVRLL